ncbi:hypothetical protein LPJ78_000478 [Coemansia sp. RSA 989]|nr:hypothetical protein BX667DRAFT_517590 [Coemansia mojavensis]KAJ1740700.1 hypothetical protein LPJ68_003542 [Coemansia sp. RSA 1086]KAJ1753101.1 hypothetical protein LPJ79_000741 [Coemansia sp. RSA 1821]KAJ1867981.1 hypothetical protein LPJ78_000478 [Coemansia sp. RSA 989]KAJ1875333.1 hypothetical protein LPJ55_000689 [Coemansia sp. RSA 990]KAJ2674307.1 hypothetical protein IWW42_001807 [Coemansia sp. RSA 1085]
MTESLDKVNRIVKHRISAQGEIEYSVEWACDQESTWEPSINLTNCAQLLAVYWRAFINTNKQSYLEPQQTEQAKPAKQAKRTKPTREPQDRIAMAKRVQANKQLRGSLARNAGASGSVSLKVKPPPLTAKRSVSAAVSAMAQPSPVTETTSLLAGLRIPKKRVQRARKSTGGRHVPPPPQ